MSYLEGFRDAKKKNCRSVSRFPIIEWLAFQAPHCHSHRTWQHLSSFAYYSDFLFGLTFQRRIFLEDGIFVGHTFSKTLLCWTSSSTLRPPGSKHDIHVARASMTCGYMTKVSAYVFQKSSDTSRGPHTLWRITWESTVATPLLPGRNLRDELDSACVGDGAGGELPEPSLESSKGTSSTWTNSIRHRDSTSLLLLLQVFLTCLNKLHEDPRRFAKIHTHQPTDYDRHSSLCFRLSHSSKWPHIQEIRNFCLGNQWSNENKAYAISRYWLVNDEFQAFHVDWESLASMAFKRAVGRRRWPTSPYRFGSKKGQKTSINYSWWLITLDGDWLRINWYKIVVQTIRSQGRRQKSDQTT